MAEVTFTFNGVDSSTMGVNLLGVQRDMAMPIDIKTLDIPGRAGSYFVGSTKKSRTVTIMIGIPDISMQALRDRVRALAAWLVTDVPASLTFSDDAGKQYFAILSGETTLSQLLSYGQVELTFTLPDPYTYATTEDVSELVVGDNSIVNAGGVPAPPRFVIPCSQPMTYLKLTGPDGRFIQIGETDSAEEDAVPPTTVILNDACDSMVPWTVGASADGGVVAGAAVSDLTVISPNLAGGSFGTGTLWHGPTIRQDLGVNVQDFELDVKLKNTNNVTPWTSVSAEAHTLTGTTGSKLLQKSVNGKVVTGVIIKPTSGTEKYSSRRDFIVYTSGGDSYVKRRSGSRISSGQSVKIYYKYLKGKVGRTEVYLLDVNGTRVVRIGLMDNSSTAVQNKVYAYAGPAGTAKAIYAPNTPNKSTYYNNINGHMSVKREGNKWTFYVAKTGTTGDTSVMTATWTDDTGIATAAVRVIDVHFGAYGANGPIVMNVGNVKLTRINTIGAEVPVTIADGSDVFIIDCNRAAVYKNDVPCMQDVNFASEFFSIPVGTSNVVIDTDGDFDTLDAGAYITKRWL